MCQPQIFQSQIFARQAECETRNARLEVIIATYYEFGFYLSIRCSAKRDDTERDSGKNGFIFDFRTFHRLHSNAFDPLKTSTLPSKCYQNLLAATDYDSITYFFRHCVNCHKMKWEQFFFCSLFYINDKSHMELLIICRFCQ